MRNRIRILAATGLVAAGLVGIGGAANAASISTATGPITGVTNATIKQNTTTYSAPADYSPQIDYLNRGDRVEALCQRTGQEINGRSVWFKIVTGSADNGTQRLSYAHADAISVPITLPYCS